MIHAPTGGVLGLGGEFVIQDSAGLFLDSGIGGDPAVGELVIQGVGQITLSSPSSQVIGEGANTRLLTNRSDILGLGFIERMGISNHGEIGARDGVLGVIRANNGGNLRIELEDLVYSGEMAADELVGTIEAIEASVVELNGNSTFNSGIFNTRVRASDSSIVYLDDISLRNVALESQTDALV